MKDDHNEMLTHAVKAIRYRFIKATTGSKPDFGSFRLNGENTRTPCEIVNHMHDLVQKTRTMIIDNHFNVGPFPLLEFSAEQNRFLLALS